MRLTLSALVVAAGLAGFGAAAQAAPVGPAPLAGIGSNDVVPVQMMRRHRMERRMMRRDMHRRRVMRRRMMRRM